MGIAAGDTVSANSSTEVIVIIGTQSFEATATLTSAQVASVKVGYPAQVAVDGLTGSVAGSVSQVGPVQSTTDGYTYPVVVALPATAKGLFSGSSANVSIQTAEAKNVVVVPTSAIVTTATRNYVLMVSSEPVPSSNTATVGGFGGGGGFGGAGGTGGFGGGGGGRFGGGGAASFGG